MPFIDVLAPLLVGSVFLYLYSKETELVYKFAWLFIGIAFLTFGLFNNTTWVSDAIAYTDTSLIAFGSTMGIVLFFVAVYFCYLMVKKRLP